MKKPVRVLLVDDDPAALAMLSLTLRHSGMRVDTATAAEEALQMLRQAHYDWLITDGHMSPVNGFDLSVLAKGEQPDLHILMVSALYGEGDIKGYPIEGTFQKPIPVEALMERLNSPPSRHASAV